ncbi:hypothetical protein NDU88_002748 [Pleurodeles waltl]|uniref:Uncharacterized protein n=1 Tax=Pleurodeles waltl TaxID=8319 RepID=A0AAV7MPP8_PLEWA|nr:hypothetical protein NDU88_002748 [Pleurodeles waltl]
MAGLATQSRVISAEALPADSVDTKIEAAGTNQLSLTAVTQGPGIGTAEPRKEEKLASRRQEGHNQEGEESGIVGKQTSSRRREEDEEEPGRRTNFAVAREAERGTSTTLLEKRGTISRRPVDGMRGLLRPKRYDACVVGGTPQRLMPGNTGRALKAASLYWNRLALLPMPLGT